MTTPGSEVTPTSADLWQVVDAQDPRISAGLRAQARTRRETLEAGAARVGWKVGWNDLAVRRGLGVRSGVIGYFLSDSVAVGDVVATDGSAHLGVEFELALEVGQRNSGSGAHSIQRIAPAIEVLDISVTDVTDAVAVNVWHRGVSLGVSRAFASDLAANVNVTVTVNGGEAHLVGRPTPAMLDFDAILRFIESGVRALGDQLLPGDWIIAGNLAPSPMWVSPGDHVSADFGPLGRASAVLST